MARSAAELRAMVDGANQTLMEGQASLRVAQDRLDQAASQYRQISDKLAAAVQTTMNATTRVDEALTLTLQAAEQANNYSATL